MTALPFFFHWLLFVKLFYGKKYFWQQAAWRGLFSSASPCAWSIFQTEVFICIKLFESSLFLVIPHRPNNIFTIFSVYFLKNLFFFNYLYCLSYVHKMFIIAKMHFKWLWLLSSPRHFQRWCVVYRLSNVWKESKYVP